MINRAIITTGLIRSQEKLIGRSSLEKYLLNSIQMSLVKAM
jgi:hypothetical protein